MKWGVEVNMSQGRRTFLFIVLLVFCFVFFSNVSVAETLNESDSEQIALSYLSEQSGIDSTFIQKMFVISHVFQGSNDKHERRNRLWEKSIRLSSD